MLSELLVIMLNLILVKKYCTLCYQEFCDLSGYVLTSCHRIIDSNVRRSTIWCGWFLKDCTKDVQDGFWSYVMQNIFQFSSALLLSLSKSPTHRLYIVNLSVICLFILKVKSTEESVAFVLRCNGM